MDPWGNASPLSDGNDAAMGRKDVMGRTDGRTPWEGRTDGRTPWEGRTDGRKDAMGRTDGRLSQLRSGAEDVPGRVLPFVGRRRESKALRRHNIGAHTVLRTGATSQGLRGRKRRSLIVSHVRLS